MAAPAVLAAAASLAGSKLSGIDKATLIVRSGRVLYATGAVYVAGVWYFGWRNQRVGKGEYSFPVPGLTDRKVRYPGGAGDAPDAKDLTPQQIAEFGALPVISDTIAGSKQPAAQVGGGRAATLVYIGQTAQSAFKLRVGEHPRFGGVDPVHTANSWHYKGRAIDVSGDPRQMALFANWVADNYGSELLELFWNGTNARNVKNGRAVPKGFVAGHTDHVHVAM